MATMTLVEAVRDALAFELERNPALVLLGEDIGRNGGVFRATEGLWERFGPERVLDTPIAESGIVGMAIGMALAGLRPVAEIEFADFLYPAFDQIVSELSKLRYRSAGQFPAPVVLRTPSGGGIKGGHYHSQSPEAYFVHTAGLVVAIPSTPADARGLDLSLLTYGAMVPVAERAALDAEADGIGVEVIDLRTLWPLDIEAVTRSVARTGRAVVVHEAPKSCGYGAELVSLLQEKVFLHLKAPVSRVAGFDTPFPYALEKLYLPDSQRVLNAIRFTWDY